MSDTDPAQPGRKPSIECVPLARHRTALRWISTADQSPRPERGDHQLRGIVVSLLIPLRRQAGRRRARLRQLGRIPFQEPVLRLPGWTLRQPHRQGPVQARRPGLFAGKNDGENHLHGGKIGFDKVVWSPNHSCRDAWLAVQYLSPDGDEGIQVHSRSSSATPCPIKMSSSSTTRLHRQPRGQPHPPQLLPLDGAEGDTLGHLLTINADTFTPVDAGLIPTGEVRASRHAMDFTQPRPSALTLGPKIAARDRPRLRPQLILRQTGRVVSGAR